MQTKTLVRVGVLLAAALLVAACNNEGVGSFSPAGDRLTLVRGGTQLFSVAVDGGSQAQISDKLNLGMSTTFSPFGDKIAYMDNTGDIFVVNTTGGGAQQVFDGGATVGLLSFVPSGHLVYVQAVGSEYTMHKILPGSSPTTVDLVPGNVQQLFVSQPAIKVKRGTGNAQFVILPYGESGAQSRLVFVATQGTQAYKFTATQTDIVGPELLPRTITPALEANLFETRNIQDVTSAAISPDGTKLVVRTGPNEGPWSLWALDLSTNEPWIQLALGAGFPPVYAFSPDGSALVFESNREGGRAVYLANANGTGIRKLAEGAMTPGWFSSR
jgi:WD40 repeat protein